ncbi:uncharacterized protein Bfra_011804 [Botrytis fragariae]|uniref:Uncharacterized protein n=1 Tax=Botrytis fragariae TaxID=1964551 RepID=A0A8H6AJZ3_9HELO|nr:uncharacterized protein Bfra_011804 [Botrytis fragariae]KAF5868839.1 hypothetical protein Bfra_011804 [Botrytis fragariae]
MSKNSLDNLAPGVKPALFDPRKKKVPQQPSLSHMLTQRPASNKGPATQPPVDTEMGDCLGSEPGVVTPQQGSQGVVRTEPAEKKEAVIFGAGMYGTVSADGNNKFHSSKIFGISFNGGKRIDEDALKFQLVALDEDFKAHKKDSKERCDMLEAEIVDLKTEVRELEKQKMEKTKEINELLGYTSKGASLTDPASQNTPESNSTIARLTTEKKTLNTFNRRMIQDNEKLKKEIDDLKERINDLESEDQAKEHKIQALQDVLDAEKMCHKSDMDTLQGEYNELTEAFDERESECKKLDVQVDELIEERDQLSQELEDVRAQDISDEAIKFLTKERDQLQKELDDARAQDISDEAIQSLTSERDQLEQQLNDTRQQLNHSEQKEREKQAELNSIMAEIERMKPEFHETTQKAATVDGLNQNIQLLQEELNRVKNDLTNANAERSQAIEAKDQTITAANQALLEFNSSNSAKLIQQLRTSIENLESEKTIYQNKITTLEADITKIHKDHEEKLLSIQQTHQYIIQKKNAAIEGHQNKLCLVQNQHQEMVKEKDEMVQRLKAEASTSEASLRKFVLEAKKSANAAELEEKKLRGELGVAKNSVLEVQSATKLMRNDLTKLQTEIESVKTILGQTDKKAKLAEKQLAETAELLVKEQNAHKEWKKNHSADVIRLAGMSKSSRLRAHFAEFSPSNVTDQEGLFELEEESVTPVRTRTLACDAPSIASLFKSDESEIALMKATIRSRLESAKADTKAEFTEEIKTELREELVESIKVELREELVGSIKAELREELVESVKAEIEEALLTSSTMPGQEIQTSQPSVMAFEGQENSLNLAGIVTSDPATSTFVHETAERNASAMNGSLIDGQTPIPVIVTKGKSLPRSKAYSWSMVFFILLLTSLWTGCLRNSGMSPTSGVVRLIDAPRPAIIPIATMNAPLLATRTTFQLAVIPATASASVQFPQVTTGAVLPNYADYLTPILHRSGIIYLYRIVAKVKSVVTWDVFKTSGERVARFFSREG